MAYKRSQKVYNLDFEGTDLDGLHVKARSMALGPLMDLNDLIENAGITKQTVDEICERFASVLIEWDMQDELGVPVAADKAGLLACDINEVRQIVDAWRDALTGVPAPLEPTSDDGQQSLEASIPMETPSASLVS